MCVRDAFASREIEVDCVVLGAGFFLRAVFIFCFFFVSVCSSISNLCLVEIVRDC